MRPVDLGATRLFVLRHGRSLANEASIIVSRLDNGLLPQYALAPAGVEQAAAAGTALLAWLTANGVAPTDVCVLASPFSRTVQTAHTAVAQLGLDAARVVRTDEALRERFFGDALELRDHSLYEGVWKDDAADPRSVPGGNGESAQDVAERLGALLHCALADQPRVLLLVAHGDTLQILQALLAQREAGADEARDAVLANHRRFALQTGELRLLA